MKVYNILENSGIDMTAVMLSDVLRYVAYIQDKTPNRMPLSKSTVKRRLAVLGYSDVQINKYFPSIGKYCVKEDWQDGDVVFRSANTETYQPTRALEVVK